MYINTIETINERPKSLCNHLNINFLRNKFHSVAKS